MFGLLVSGRLVDTSFREVKSPDSSTKIKSFNINLFQVDNTHCVIDVDGAGSFNHLVVSSLFYNQKVRFGSPDFRYFLPGNMPFQMELEEQCTSHGQTLTLVSLHGSI